MRIKIEPAKNSSLYQIYSPAGFEFSISAKGIFETGLSTEKEIEEISKVIPKLHVPTGCWVRGQVLSPSFFVGGRANDVHG